MLPVATQPLFVPSAHRDVALATLEALARVRIATVAGLVAYARPDGFDAELLGVWQQLGFLLMATAITDPVRGTSTNVVAVSPAGARAVTEATGHTVHGVSPARLKRSSRKLAHDAGVGDTLLAILALARTGSPLVRGIEADDRSLATSAALGLAGRAVRVPLQPDAYVLVGDAAGSRGLLIEYDRGTTAAAKLRTKFAAYAAWREAKGPERTFAIRALRVLTIVPDDARLARLHDVALEAVGRRSGFFLFATAASITPADPERLRGPVVRQLGDDGSVPLFAA